MPAMNEQLRSPCLAWLFRTELLLEIFVAINLAVLTGNIWFAHSANQFHNPAEYIPLYFSADAPILLLVAMLAKDRWRSQDAWRDIGLLVGGLSILIGLAGVVFHLRSGVFPARPPRSLPYAAPFVAPLAYVGLGLLLLMNRMVAAYTVKWARWVILFAAGGFFGNFILCVTDHAINGFILKAEWIPVVSSALATDFLILPIICKVTRRYLDLCLFVIGLQALVGFLGFAIHLRRNYFIPGISLFEMFVYGAPPMAPLLFPDLAMLALIGLWQLAPHFPPAASDEHQGIFDRLLRWATVAPANQ